MAVTDAHSAPVLEINTPAALADRLAQLRQVGTRLAARRQDLITAAASDTGTPAWVAGLEVDLAVEHLQTMDQDVSLVKGKRPYGTVAAIFPYDAAPIMLARVGGAAMLGGNRFRFSFSSQTPRQGEILADIVAPWEVLEPRWGYDNRRFGEECVVDPQVRVFFISGAGEVGRAYEARAAHFDKLFFAGPSGMPAVLVFPDADLAQAASFIVRRAYLNGGQYCTTIKKAYITQEVYPAVKTAIVAQMPRIKVGEPDDPEVWIGPLKVGRTREGLTQALAALNEADFLWPPRLEDPWVGPLLLESACVPDLEAFGPLLVLIPVADGSEAVARVQETRYPFAVSFFGTPPRGGAGQLRETFGMVYDNPDFTFTPLRLPFGGKGDSGWILEKKGGALVRRSGALQYSAELVQPAT